MIVDLMLALMIVHVLYLLNYGWRNWGAVQSRAATAPFVIYTGLSIVIWSIAYAPVAVWIMHGLMALSFTLFSVTRLGKVFPYSYLALMCVDVLGFWGLMNPTLHFILCAAVLHTNMILLQGSNHGIVVYRPYFKLADCKDALVAVFQGSYVLFGKVDKGQTTGH